MQLLHLALRRDWEDALAAGTYRVSTRGATLDDVGFIHASTAAQVQGTASRFYADLTEPLVVLVLDEDRLGGNGVEVRWEDAGDGELFPHLYAALPVALVDEVRQAAYVDGRLVY